MPNSPPNLIVLTAPELLALDLPPRALLLDPLLRQRTLTLLHGPRGIGKSLMALGIAWAVAGGGGFLKWPAPKPRRVLYIDGEMATFDMRERLRTFGPAPATLEFLLADRLKRRMPDLARDAGQRLVWEPWQTTGVPDLLVLDSLSSLVGIASKDPGDWVEVRRWLLDLRNIGMAILVVHHDNRSGQPRGASRREDVFDTVLSLRPPAGKAPRDGARFEIHFDKARSLYGAAVEPIEAHLLTDDAGLARWQWCPAGGDELAHVAALLKAGMNPNQVARELGISKSRSYRLRERVMGMGLAGEH